MNCWKNPTGIIAFMLTILGLMLRFLTVPPVSWCFSVPMLICRFNLRSIIFWTCKGTLYAHSTHNDEGSDYSGIQNLPARCAQDNAETKYPQAASTQGRKARRNTDLRYGSRGIAFTSNLPEHPGTPLPFGRNAGRRDHGQEPCDTYA